MAEWTDSWSANRTDTSNASTGLANQADTSNASTWLANQADTPNASAWLANRQKFVLLFTGLGVIVFHCND